MPVDCSNLGAAIYLWLRQRVVVVAGADPVAVYRWSILRSFFKAVYAFKIAGKQCRSSKKKSVILTAPFKVEGK